MLRSPLFFCEQGAKRRMAAPGVIAVMVECVHTRVCSKNIMFATNKQIKIHMVTLPPYLYSLVSYTELTFLLETVCN